MPFIIALPHPGAKDKQKRVGAKVIGAGKLAENLVTSWESSIA